MKKSQKQFNIRLKVVFGGIMLIGFVLITNLFYIQVRTGDDLRVQADGQYIVSTYNSFERGNIYFENIDESQTTVAGQKKGYKISINPSTLNDEKIEKIYTEINNIHEIDRDTFIERAGRNERSYIEVANHISKQDGELIKEKIGKLIGLHVEKWRIYPLKESASHVLGFLGFDDDDNFDGRYGLENYYDNTLKREDKNLYTNFFARAFHGVQDLVDSDRVTEGNIIASIDPQIQLFLEKELMGIQDKWNGEATGGIIMNPRTGEIVAMASIPNFDNNNFGDKSLSLFKNPIVSNVYEFGSTMKPLVVAIGLNDEVITAESEYYDKGYVNVEKHTIYNFDKKGRGWVNVQEVLNQSLNTGMVFVNSKIEKDSFVRYFRKYGFGEKSGIDLPNDSTGLTSNLKSKRDIEFANMAFGQGIAISPISMIKAISALANDGKTVTPHIIKRIEYTNGFSKTLEYDDGKQVISPETSGEISKMLVNVFDNYQNGGLKLDNHSVAAKTGTAQIPAPDGGYYDDRNLHSFFGYFPAYDPEFVILLYTVYPKQVRYASQTLIGPFRSTAKYLINYYNISPDR